jgi:hypothetical protein
VALLTVAFWRAPDADRYVAADDVGEEPMMAVFTGLCGGPVAEPGPYA